MCGVHLLTPFFSFLLPFPDYCSFLPSLLEASVHTAGSAFLVLRLYLSPQASFSMSLKAGFFSQTHAGLQATLCQFLNVAHQEVQPYASSSWAPCLVVASECRAERPKMKFITLEPSCNPALRFSPLGQLISHCLQSQFQENMVAHTGDLSIWEAHGLVASLCYMEIPCQNKIKQNKTPNLLPTPPTTKNKVPTRLSI